MARWLGLPRRERSKEAERSGYLVEIEPVWEHQCRPPIERGTFWDYPVLSNGDQADVGTLWRCECGQVSEVYCPDARKPGVRLWRAVTEVEHAE